MKLMNRTNKIIDKLRKEGKISYSPSPFSQDDLNRIEKRMQVNRRKLAASSLAAKNTIIC